MDGQTDRDSEQGLERAQEALSRANKELQAVRAFAAAIAHDFNNSIAAIAGWAEFALDGVDPQSPTAKALKQIAQEARRVVQLTRELAAFSRAASQEKQEVALEGDVPQLPDEEAVRNCFFQEDSSTEDLPY